MHTPPGQRQTDTKETRMHIDDGTQKTTGNAAAGHGWSAREKGLAAAALLAVAVAAVAVVLFINGSVHPGAAAKVDDSYIAEDDVTTYISQYRTRTGLTDDAQLAQALSSQSLTVSSFRINAIDQLAISMLVNKRAQELGVTPGDEEVQEQVDEVKSSLSLNDEDTWQQTLQQYGMTDEQVTEQYRNSLAQRAVCEQDVARPEASKAQGVSYAQANLAGQQQQHYLCIVFKGDGKTENAYACLKKLKAAGKMSAATFKRFVSKYSEDEDSKGKDGEYGWTLGLDSSNDVTEVLGNMKVGELSEVEAIDDDTSAIFFCDTGYTFPSEKKISKLKAKDIPSTLMDALRDKASDALWNSACTSYLAGLLAKAQITYYPLPEDAPYNVDLTSSSDSSSDSSSSETTGTDASGASSIADSSIGDGGTGSDASSTQSD